MPATRPLKAHTPRHTSKSETAKQEAGDVAHQATDSAQHVAETAKAEAANVAGEVKANAKDLLYQAKTDLTDQAGAQQQKVAHGLHSISGELRTMADASEQPGVAADLIRQAADRSASVASWLEGRDPGSLLNEVKTFARQRPGTFLLLAAGAGILAGRLTRSLSEGAPGSAGGVLRADMPHVRRFPVCPVPAPPVPMFPIQAWRFRRRRYSCRLRTSLRQAWPAREWVPERMPVRARTGMRRTPATLPTSTTRRIPIRPTRWRTKERRRTSGRMIPWPATVSRNSGRPATSRKTTRTVTIPFVVVSDESPISGTTCLGSACEGGDDVPW